MGDKGQQKKIHPHKFTLWVAIASILMMFAGLTSAFIVKSNLVGWQQIKMPKVFWISTAVLLISSLTIQAALRSFRQREMKNYRLLVAITLLLGIAFLIMQWFGFTDLWEQQKVTFKGSAGAGQFLYVIFGLHALHIAGGVIALLILFSKAFFGSIKTYSPVSLEVASIYWHFVDLLWVYLFLFFILIG